MRLIHQPRGRMPIAPDAIPGTAEGRNRVSAAPPGNKNRREIILQRPRLTSAVPILAGGSPVSSAGQSRVAANTTTRRQEVDESWTYFNIQLIIN